MEMRRGGLGDDERDRNERAKMRGLKRSREEGVEEHLPGSEGGEDRGRKGNNERRKREEEETAESKEGKRNVSRLRENKK